MIKIELNDIDNNQLGVLDVEDHEDFPLALNESISDIKNPAGRGGSYSLNFKVPATRNNNQVLEHLYDVNILDSKSIYSKKPTNIIINGTQYVNYNFFKVRKVSYGHGKAEYYDMVIFGENMSWAVQLKELPICELEYRHGGTLTFEYVKLLCERTWSNFLTDPDNYDFVMCPINYGGWEKKDYVSVNDLRPQVRVLAILKKGFLTLGYTIESAFLNSDAFKDKIMTFFGGGFRITDQQILDRGFFVLGDTPAIDPKFNDRRFFVASFGAFVYYFDYDTSSHAPASASTTLFPILIPEIQYTQILSFTDLAAGYYDNGGNWDTVNDLAENSGYINFILRFNFDIYVPVFNMQALLSGSANHLQGCRVKIEIINSTDGVIATWESDLLEGAGAHNTGDIELESGFYEVRPGETTQVKLTYTHVLNALFVSIFNSTASIIPVAFRIDSATVIINSLDFKAEIGEKIVEGEPFVIGDKLDCATSVMDVIDGLVAPYNLYFRTDSILKKVYIEPRDDFYKDNSEAKDWSNKLDVNADCQLDFLTELPRHWIFKWADDSGDAFQKWWFDKYGKALGSYELELANKFVENKTQYVQSSLFAPQYHIEDINIAEDKEKPVYIAAMFNALGVEAEYSNEFRPRILNYKYASQQTSDGSFVKIAWYSRSNLLAVFPQAFQVDFIKGTEDNLYFGNYDIDSTSRRGNFDLYWNRTMKVIELAKQLTGKFLLKDSDMRAIDLRYPVFLGKPQVLHGNYIVDSVKNFKPAKQNITTQCVLLRRVDDEFDVEDEIFILELPIHSGLVPASGVDERYNPE